MKTLYFCKDKQSDLDLRTNELEMAGYEVLVFDTGGDLMRAIAKEAPDAVLLDVLLEGQSGFEVCENLKLNDRDRFPVVLFAGVYTRPIYREAALALGVSAYLRSDLSREQLCGAVAHALGRDAGTRTDGRSAA